MAARPQSSRLFAVFGGVMLVSAGVLACAEIARGQVSLKVLYAFSGGPYGYDGANPHAALIQATDGNFYGTTASGGEFFGGTVFQITPDGTVTFLHGFGRTDGSLPEAALIQATDGNFYGTTIGGGGTVFRMIPDGTVTVLHAFTGGADGTYPYAALIQVADGNFYGTTERGGGGSGCASDGCGTVFRMTPDGTVTVLYAFTGGADGGNPDAALIQAGDGSFYGTTTNKYGRTDFNRGTVFRMTADGRLTTLHTFTGGTDGDYPEAAVLQASDGNFYGTTTWGGGSGCLGTGCGTVFRMTPDGTVTVLHAFAGSTDGAHPVAPLILAADGTFYGTTAVGGGSGCRGNGCGIAFQMRPDGIVTILHAFDDTEGGQLRAALIQGNDGNFYGTAALGGFVGSCDFDLGCGTVFQMIP